MGRALVGCRWIRIRIREDNSIWQSRAGCAIWATTKSIARWLVAWIRMTPRIGETGKQVRIDGLAWGGTTIGPKICAKSNQTCSRSPSICSVPRKARMGGTKFPSINLAPIFLIAIMMFAVIKAEIRGRCKRWEKFRRNIRGRGRLISISYILNWNNTWKMNLERAWSR